MRLTIRTKAFVLTAIPLAAMLVALALAVAYAQRTDAIAAWALHSEDVLHESSAVVFHLSTASRAAERYRISHRATARRAFTNALRATNEAVADLLKRVSDDPEQIARAQHYARAVRLGERYLRAAAFGGSYAGSQRAGALFASAANDFERAERRLAAARFRTLAYETRALARSVLIAFIVAIALTALSLLSFAGSVIVRLRQLSSNVLRLARGDPPVALHGNDEFSDLDRAFRDVTERMRRAREVSTQLQRALLPHTLPEVAGLRIDATYRPSSRGTEVGGDWYDVFTLDENTVGITIGDITGHGVRAASSMATVRQTLQTAARFTRDAASVLQLANHTICDEGGAIASAFVAIADRMTGAMEYATAGHPAPITVRATGTIGLLPADGLLLGVEHNTRYENHYTRLETGAALIFYTDGAVETYRGDYSRGLSDLIEAVSATYYQTSGNIAAAIADRLFATREPVDDCALLFVGVSELGAQAAAGEHRWQLDARNPAEARRLKRALLWHLGQCVDQDADLSAAELILGELLGNVARHTNGQATVILELADGRATLHVEDGGAPIPPHRSPQDELAEGGRGLPLVETLARDLRVGRRDRGNVVSAELPLTVKGP